MGYSSKSGRRPIEMASKSSHHHIINDPSVQALLSRLQTMPRVDKSGLDEVRSDFSPPSFNPIDHVIAVDGGYAEVVIEKEFPSRLMHFIQVGALYFKREDLARVEKSTFILPEDMAKLKNIERLK